MYETKQAVGLLKEDEEPLDPGMTNWADYAFNFGVIEPDLKIQLHVGNHSSSESPKKENKGQVQAVQAQIVEQSPQIVQELSQIE